MYPYRSEELAGIAIVVKREKIIDHLIISSWFILFDWTILYPMKNKITKQVETKIKKSA